jgi:hypothetical protein
LRFSFFGEKDSSNLGELFEFFDFQSKE